MENHVVKASLSRARYTGNRAGWPRAGWCKSLRELSETEDVECVHANLIALIDACKNSIVMQEDERMVLDG
jgi:hypothetical protein